MYLTLQVWRLRIEIGWVSALPFAQLRGSRPKRRYAIERHLRQCMKHREMGVEHGTRRA